MMNNQQGVSHTRTIQLQSALNQKRLLTPLDVVLVGATEVGKSSTLNALFGSDVAEVGKGSQPQTQIVADYRVGQSFRLYDTAGFGDGKEADERHAKNLVFLLRDTCTSKQKSYFLMDLVLVILDGSSRDLGTSYKLLTDVILPNIEPSRVLVAINKADMAMSGRYWDFEKNQPQPRLIEFLNEKVHSTKERIKEATGLTIPTPIYYSAERNYNIDEIFGFIINNLPTHRRYLN
ncbi:50S ribosome-binding GTPase [Moraxella bovis]|uniref:50S ribosome-binding GTPase n=2 Tax=Moraxella bovis TaxID=476 RepID=A0AAQ2T042_MORBO|nr:GTPase [Moraxella bovis]UYZ75471.1 50S ribosome-binding GTPase [Moraxella bovis]UYZ78587.1 50S ribosome-binding GTPase [Moraxella bovis]UYZ81477.1 50S ribosome-binding GTPase [Moraxella bovis]UYZ87069.1 50S ribosome-binding GTPase [Moraxella bovis]UYZ89231.1 50S ribosome-binding GTPase [Moraxella bovis]